MQKNYPLWRPLTGRARERRICIQCLSLSVFANQPQQKIHSSLYWFKDVMGVDAFVIYACLCLNTTMHLDYFLLLIK